MATLITVGDGRWSVRASTAPGR